MRFARLSAILTNDIAQRALDLRDGNSIIPAYQALRMADPVRADQFAREALKIAGMNYDSFLFFALAQVAAPFPGLPVQLKAPEELRAEILKVLAAGMLRPPVGPADKQNICELATPVTMAMKAFPPAQAVQLRVAVDNCKAANADLRDNISAMDIHSREGTPSECWARPTKRTMRSRGHR